MKSSINLAFLALLLFATISNLYSQVESTTVGGEWDQTTTWIGGIVPGSTDSVVINGAVRLFFDDPTISSLTISENGSLESGWESTITVYNNVVVNGATNLSEGNFMFYIGGDLELNGNWHGGLSFLGDVDHYLSAANGVVFNPQDYLISEGTLHLNTDLHLENDNLANIITNKLIIENNSTIDSDGCRFGSNTSSEFQSIDKTIIEGGTIKMSGGYQVYYENCDLIDLTFEGLSLLNSSINMYGEITNTDTLISAFHDITINVKGNLTNDGYIYGQNHYYVEFNITGNLTNNGTILSDEPGISSGVNTYINLKGNLTNNGNYQTTKTKLIGSVNQELSLTNEIYSSEGFIIESRFNEIQDSYQWMLNHVDLNDETDSSLVLSSIATDDATFVCKGTNDNQSREIIINNGFNLALEIFDVEISHISNTTATISWKTNIPAQGFIFYAEEDTSNGFPLEAMEPFEYVTDHSITLTGLTKGATYYFIIDESDEDWNNTRDGTYSFTTFDADFSSVQDGNWNEPSTWSFDTNATTIPSENSNVLILHQVSVQTSYSKTIPTCFNLQISSEGRIYGYASAYSSPGLTVKNNFENYGTFNWNNDCTLTIEGNMYNHGIIKGDVSYNFNINLYGNLVNSGSFRAVGHQMSYFTNGINFKGANGHNIQCLNDSTIYSRYFYVDDPDGWMVIDSLANLSGAIRLGGKGLVINYHEDFKAKLVMEEASLFGGIVYANGNEIASKQGSTNSLGYLYDNFTNLEIQSAVFEGNFRVSGGLNPENNSSLVILDGNCVSNGSIYNWGTTSTLYGDLSGLIIRGSLTNNGELKNSWTDQLAIYLADGSSLINYGKIDNLSITAYGNCSLETTDTLSVAEFKAANDSTSLDVYGDLIFDKNVKIDFNGGDLNMNEGSTFITNNGWQNSVKNINIYGNISNLSLIQINDNTNIYDDVSFGYVLANGTNINTYGQTKILPNGTLTCTNYDGGTINFYDDLKNLGKIKHADLDYGYLHIHLKSNLIHDGAEWSNSNTYIDGDTDQFLIFPNDSVITGKVNFVASLTGTNYQWQKDGIDIQGAINSSFTLNGISSSKYGTYQCFVDGASDRKIFIGNVIPPPFRIEDVVICNLDETKTYVGWTTTEPTSGYIFYAKNDTTYGFPFEAWEDWEFKKEHSLILDDLEKDSTYYLNIYAEDEDWNNIGTKTYTFVAGDISDNLFAIESVEDVPDDEGSFVELIFRANKLDSIGLIQNYVLMTNHDGNWQKIEEIEPMGNEIYSRIIQIPNPFNLQNEVSAKFKVIANYVLKETMMESNIVEGVAIDNLAPSTPSIIEAAQINNGKAIKLSWSINNENDFSQYIVYRNGEEYFKTMNNMFVDENIRNGVYSYEVEAIDIHENVSGKSTVAEITVDAFVDFDIFDITVKPISETSVTIFWKTTIPSNGFVYYTETNTSSTDTLFVEEWTELKRSHSITLNELSTGITYDFLIEQFDKDGFRAESDILDFAAGDLSQGVLAINSIVDVPMDQGAWVYVNFEADILDAVGEIVRYGIWQWLENEWVSLGSIPATQVENYTFLAHTNKDFTEENSNYSKFYISAHTANPMIYYNSMPDSGYSIDNIVPEVPIGLIAEFNVESKSVVLNWAENNDIDLQYYKIYRNNTLLQTSVSAEFEDINIDELSYDYNISAVDTHGNESELSLTETVFIVGVNELGNTQDLAIINYPNPAKDFTTFKVTNEINSDIKIEIYDLSGKNLEVIFNGLPSDNSFEIEYETKKLIKGIYYYVLTSEHKSITKRLVVQ